MVREGTGMSNEHTVGQGRIHGVENCENSQLSQRANKGGGEKSLGKASVSVVRL